MPRDPNYFNEMLAKCMDPTHHFTPEEAKKAMHRLVKDEPNADEIVRNALLYARENPGAGSADAFNAGWADASLSQENPGVVKFPEFNNLHTCLQHLLSILLKNGISTIATPDGELLLIDTPKKLQNVRRYIELFCDKEGELERKDSRKLKISTYLLLMNDEANRVGRNKRMELLTEYGLGQGTHGLSTYEVKVPCQMSRISVRICSYCQSINNKGGLMKCGKCMAAYYCNARCQKLAWSAHKHCCEVPSTKLKFLCMKMHSAWQACLSVHRTDIFLWLDHINQVYKQKSRTILLVGVEPAQDGFFSLEFASVSLRFFTPFEKNRHNLLYIRASLEKNPDAYLLAIPFDGYFRFSFV